MRMHGLVLEAEVACNVNSVICNGQMDFDSDPLAMSVAEAIRLKAGMLLLQKLAGSHRLNRETLMAKGSYGETIKTWGKDYNEAVLFIAESVNLGNCPCLKDKDKYGMHVGGICV
jgi:hypothetical protein